MAVPLFIRKGYASMTDKDLYYPLLTTSPTFLQAGDTYLSDLKLKDLSIKSIYLEKGKMPPNLDWDGTPYDWSSGTTEIQTQFVNSGEGRENVYNILKNSSLNDTTHWSAIYEVDQSDTKNIEHPSNWLYQAKEPADKSKIWVSTQLGQIEPQYWTGTKWENYYNKKQRDFKSSTLKLQPSTKGNVFHINKTITNSHMGIAQWAPLKTALWRNDPLTISFDFSEEQTSGGIIARIEFYDKDRKLVQTQYSPRMFNKSANKRRVSETFKYRSDNPALSVRVSILTVPERKVEMEVFHIMLSNQTRDVGWNLHEDEVLLNLGAGEISLPMIGGELDKSKYISEIAILRSTLGEGLLRWEEVTRLKSSSVQDAVLHDYFVENGNYYRYALQPILANGSKGAITHYYDAVATFDGFWILGEEDMQFSFIYNGKIDSINHIKPRDIVQTIAGQYPYIIRSSELDYRTFNFSGTLTYHQDVQKNFTSDNYSVAISPDPSAPVSFVETKYGDEMLLNCKNDLEEVQDGMVMQRLWRNKVLKWLNDGKPKILKSEAQGNLLVFIDEVKMTPNETTFGLIADFSCRMTEIGSLSEKTLQKFKLRKTEISKEELIKEAMDDNEV